MIQAGAEKLCVTRNPLQLIADQRCFYWFTDKLTVSWMYTERTRIQSSASTSRPTSYNQELHPRNNSMDSFIYLPCHTQLLQHTVKSAMHFFPGKQKLFQLKGDKVRAVKPSELWQRTDLTPLLLNQNSTILLKENYLKRSFNGVSPPVLCFSPHLSISISPTSPLFFFLSGHWGQRVQLL